MSSEFDLLMGLSLSLAAVAGGLEGTAALEAALLAPPKNGPSPLADAVRGTLGSLALGAADSLGAAGASVFFLNRFISWEASGHCGR